MPGIAAHRLGPKGGTGSRARIETTLAELEAQTKCGRDKSHWKELKSNEKTVNATCIILC